MSCKNMISIIVPIYKAELYLKQCIESILNQTYRNIELILVNDGSPDDSLKICREYEASDSRIFIIDKSNGGVSSARNAGLANAHGEFIMFVDSDDWLTENTCQTLIDEFEYSNCDVIYYEMLHEFISTTKFDAIFDVERIEFDESNINKLKILCIPFANTNQNRMSIYGPYCKMYKKNVIKELTFNTELMFGEDAYFNLLALENCKRVGYIRLPLYHYRERQSSLSKSFSKSRMEQSILRMKLTSEHVKRVHATNKEIKNALDMFVTNMILFVINYFTMTNLININEAILTITDFVQNTYIKNIIKKIEVEDLTWQSSLKFKMLKNNKITLLVILMRTKFIVGHIKKKIYRLILDKDAQNKDLLWD